MVAEVERDVLERVGEALAGRIGELRTALLNLSRTSTDYLTRQAASDALRRDEALDLGVEYRPPAFEPDRVLCIRCKGRQRMPGSMWCRSCEPLRSTAAMGRD